MKNSFLLSILMVSIFFFGTEINGNSFIGSSTITMNNSSMKPGPKVTLSITFGKRRLDCEEKGFCDISLDIGRAARPQNGMGQATAKIENNKLNITIIKSSLTADTDKLQFSNQEFVLDEDLVLGSDVCTKLGVRSYVLKAGKYPIVKVAEGYKIQF